MAGIDTLLRGAVGALAKDKVSPFLSPSQRDFLALVLNPQGYLLDKGINAAANALGYGSDYKTIKDDAKNNEEYYKQVMRNAAGDVLPESIGDLVRATPRISEADLQPAGIYTTFDPETETYVQRESPNPAAKPDAAQFEDFMRELNFGANLEVGPQEEYSQTRLNDEYDFATSLSDFQPVMNDSAPVTETPADSSGAIDFGGTMDYSEIFGDYGGGYGGAGKGFEREMDYGGGYDPFEGSGNYVYNAKGGVIPRGRR